MKKVFYSGVFIATLMVSCDKVKQPSPYANIDCPLDTAVTNCVITSTTSNIKKILLEDYTGHFCGNCPNAARKAESLEKTYKEHLVIIACHVSATYAAPQPLNCFCPADTMYKEDFRTETGNDWSAYFGLDNQLPNGMVNRQSPFLRGWGTWSSLVDAATKKSQSVKLEITCIYDTVKTQIKVKVKSTFLKSFTSNIMMSAVLTQDSLVAFQKDYSVPAGADTLYIADLRPDYRFDNILLGSVNGSWGQLVKAAPKAKDTLTVNTPCYQLGKKCFYSNNNQYNIKDVCANDKYINLVVFVYDKDSKEVLQVEKLRIKGSQPTHN